MLIKDALGTGTLWFLSALAGSALAQTAAPAGRPQAEPPPPAYQDRIIEGLPPADVSESDKATPYNALGWPRLLRLETRLGNQAFDQDRRARLAFALYGLIDTPNYGALSADGSWSPSKHSGTLTLRQRRLPLEGGWVADHEAGVIASPAVGLSRLPSRVYLPTTTLLGAAGEWSQAGQGLTFSAGSGQPGRLEGAPAAGFIGLGGRRTTLAAQWRPQEASAPANPFALPGVSRLPGLTLALQHEQASGLNSTAATSNASLGSGNNTGANATLFAARYEFDRVRLQAQALTGANPVAGDASAATARAQGFWLDSEWDEGPRTHGLSFYRLDPNLSWAGQAMPNDLQGVSLKSGWRTRQWSADASVDWLRSVSGNRSAGTYASASARWRVSRQNSLGAGFSLRQNDGNAWSSYGDWRFENRFGPSGLRLDLTGGANSAARSQILSYDQDWAVPQGFSLTSSLGVGREILQASGESPNANANANSSASQLWSAALAFGAPLGQRANLRGTLRTEQNLGNSERNHSLSLGGTWRLDNRWSLDGQYNRRLGASQAATVSLDPLAPINSETLTVSDRSFYAVLRYEMQAGSRSAPLGGRPSDGGGRIEGTVFFDANNSGVQEASETGAANVTVYLDNRYAVRTDAQGRFEFPFVAPGPRTVTVRNETLPLPWSVVDEGQTKVDVRLRETTKLMLPVRKN